MALRWVVGGFLWIIADMAGVGGQPRYDGENGTTIRMVTYNPLHLTGPMRADEVSR